MLLEEHKPTMHELPVTENLLEITLRHAAQAGAARVTDLYLVIGDLASIVDDSVQFYWDIVSKDTAAEGAQLHFRRIPTQLYCLDCQITYEPSRQEMSCPSCGSINIRINTGEEFFLEAIDVDN